MWGKVGVGVAGVGIRGVDLIVVKADEVLTCLLSQSETNDWRSSKVSLIYMDMP